MESSSTLFEISIPRGALEDNKMMYLLKISNVIVKSHRCADSQSFFTKKMGVTVLLQIPCTVRLCDHYNEAVPRNIFTLRKCLHL